MNREQCHEAVQTRQRVQAVYATDRWVGPHAIGKVIAYCDAPSLLIETDNGERVWWRADLTVPAVVAADAADTGR